LIACLAGFPFEDVACVKLDHPERSPWPPNTPFGARVDPEITGKVTFLLERKTWRWNSAMTRAGRAWRPGAATSCNWARARRTLAQPSPAGMVSATAMQTAREVVQGFLEQAHPGTITINGVDYACSIRKSEIEPDLDEKTMTTQMLQRAQVRVLRSLLPACPPASQRVICDGLEWMIEARGAQSRHGGDLAAQAQARRHQSRRMNGLARHHPSP